MARGESTIELVNALRARQAESVEALRALLPKRLEPRASEGGVSNPLTELMVLDKLRDLSSSAEAGDANVFEEQDEGARQPSPSATPPLF